MSARTASEAPPQTVAQLYEGMQHLPRLQRDITTCLRQINNGTKRAGRFLRQVFKGITRNDQEFVPVVLNHMFGLKMVRGKMTMDPLNPGFDYQGCTRRMSRPQLQRLMEVKYKKVGTLNEGQIRRIFEGFQDAGLLDMSQTKRKTNGLWDTVVDYTFMLDAWEVAWETTLKTPRVYKRKVAERTAHQSVLDTSVTDTHRLRPRTVRDEYFPTAEEAPEPVCEASVISAAVAEKSAVKPLIFEASPCVEVQPVLSLKRGEADQLVVLPSYREQVALASVAAMGSVPAEQEKGTSAGFSFSNFPEEGQAAPRSKAPAPQQEPAAPVVGYNPILPAPLWQVLLESYLDHKIPTGNWKADLYEEDADFPGRTLKPRIYDCFIQPIASPGRPVGVYDLQDNLLPLSPAELELGDLTERLTACPLRMRDWENLRRQARLPLALRLTKDKLLLMAFAVTVNSTVEGYVDSVRTGRMERVLVDGKEHTIPESMDLCLLTLIPELLGSNFRPVSDKLIYFSTLWQEASPFNQQSVVDGKQLRAVLPFLHMGQVPSRMLLAPDNAGKLLENWRTLHTKLVEMRPVALDKHKPTPEWAKPEAVRAVERSTLVADKWHVVTESVAELSGQLGDKRGMGFRQHSLVKTLRSCEIRQLPEAVRQQLREFVLQLYCQQPAAWSELEVAIGSARMFQLCPVSNWVTLRQVAHGRVREQLARNWEPPVEEFRTSEYIG